MSTYLLNGDTKSCGCLLIKLGEQKGGWDKVGTKGITIDPGRFRAFITIKGKTFSVGRHRKLKDAIIWVH